MITMAMTIIGVTMNQAITIGLRTDSMNGELKTATSDRPKAHFSPLVIRAEGSGFNANG
jgi:hypothetical protein